MNSHGSTKWDRFGVLIFPFLAFLCLALVYVIPMAEKKNLFNQKFALMVLFLEIIHELTPERTGMQRLIKSSSSKNGHFSHEFLPPSRCRNEKVKRDNSVMRIVKSASGADHPLC